ncbi:MAG TPA: aldo/keto reductase [Acidimicrobiales bacterium]|nr:aldo/keto reductase [Acidimicrobiales bacterium]
MDVDPLPLVPLGDTGLTATPVGLGLAALGRPAYITIGRDRDLGPDRRVETMARRCHAMLDAAYDAGVRYVDAARSYGRAEEFLASWLAARGLPPGAITVGSKWGYTYVGDWRLDAVTQEVKDHSRAAFTRQRDESLAVLGRHLSLYQVHSATLESGVLEDRALHRDLVALAGTGVAVGLTVSGPAQAEVVRRALAVEVDGRSPFACVQATWNLLEPSVGPALAEAAGRGWGVLVKEALANGRLTGAVPPPSALAQVAARHGAPVDQVALAAALAQDPVDVVLSGAVTEAQLASNLTAPSALELDADDLERLGALAEPPARYWEERSRLAWA